LLNHGFQAYDGVRLYAANHPVTTIRVWKGTANQLKAGFLRDFQVALPKGGSDKAESHGECPASFAPVRAGERVGTLKLALDTQPYGEFPVVALEDVPVAGILGRGWDAIRLFFQ
jgi:D-alanyl-D-alanine carboxypeptidase (penicillin-binding protein 5/6)